MKMNILSFFRLIFKDQQGIFGLIGPGSATLANNIDIDLDPAGLFGKKRQSSQFNLPDKEIRSKIDRFQEFGESDITGPSQGGQVGLDELDRQRGIARQQASQSAQAGLSSGLSNLSLFGGAGGGSGERLARQSGRNEQLGQQQISSQFAGDRARLLSGDLINEQNRRDSALTSALSGEQSIFGARTSAELARVGIDAQRQAADAQRNSGALGAFGSLFGQKGAGIGSALGGIFG